MHVTQTKKPASHFFVKKMQTRRQKQIKRHKPHMFNFIFSSRASPFKTHKMHASHSPFVSRLAAATLVVFCALAHCQCFFFQKMKRLREEKKNVSAKIYFRNFLPRTLIRTSVQTTILPQMHTLRVHCVMPPTQLSPLTFFFFSRVLPCGEKKMNHFFRPAKKKKTHKEVVPPSRKKILETRIFEKKINKQIFHTKI